MAGRFSIFSYPASDEDAIDLCVLEHISKLNSSAHLHDDGEDYSSLPTELEARFRKLKSFPFPFPAAHTKPRSKLAALGPKKKKKNTGKGDGVGGGWEMHEEYRRVNDEMLSDLRTFSLKEQEKAEKLVWWVKQASARMEVAELDELPSDEDEKL